MGYFGTKEALELLRKGVTIKDQEQIMDLRTVILEMREENLSLKEKLQNLESRLRAHKDLVYKKPFYYVEGEQDPYCPACWENDNKAIHLKHMHKNHFLCLVCNQAFSSSDRSQASAIGSSQLTRG